MTDPRKAKTLGEAAQNPDGTYNVIKALSWLSEAVAPGRGIPEAEVKQIAEEVLAKRAAQVDTHAKRGDANAAPSPMGSAVGSEADDAPNLRNSDD